MQNYWVIYRHVSGDLLANKKTKDNYKLNFICAMVDEVYFMNQRKL